MSVPLPDFEHVPPGDANDDNQWTAMDLKDLRNTLARGGSIDDVAIFMCRGGPQDRLRKKADEMGWWPTLRD